MALGNAWHFPGNPEPFGNVGMRDPVFPADPVSAVTVFSGNQYDSRSDENRIVAQLHTIFLRFHNEVTSRLGGRVSFEPVAAVMVIG